MTPPRVVEELARLVDLVPGPIVDATKLVITGTQTLASAFDADTVALTSAAASNLAAGVTTLDRDRLAANLLCSVAVDGEPLPTWADLSGYYDAADGRTIQLHCNFPHHAAGVVARLACEPTRASVQAAIRTQDPFELEAQLIDDGMIPAVLRTLEEWDAHPHAAATLDLPVISIEQVDDAPGRDPERVRRVVDCTRVLAGPVAGQQLAAHGADVVRVGSPNQPSVPLCVMATGAGKRNAFADLETEQGKADFASLLAEADIWLDGYRPGALAAKGATPDHCAPGTVIVQISAFDWVGPWAGRRGFDSIMQSTTGIVEAGRAASGSDGPVPLPVQLLDFATGFLAAFTAQRLVAHQAEVGGTWLARLSLLRTRNWLTSLGGPTAFVPAKPTPQAGTMHTVPSDFGMLTTALPIGGAVRSAPAELGSSLPIWLDR